MAKFSPELQSAIDAASVEWAFAEKALNAEGVRVLIYGPPGTGKSFAGIKTAKKSVHRQYLTIDTPASEVRGHFVPTDGGGFAWHDGPGSQAWRFGGRVCIEEIDQASGDCLTFLLGLLDDPESASITLPNNENLRPAPGFSAVATTNELPTILSAALLDRFDAVISITKPNPEAFQASHWFNQDLRLAAASSVFLNKTPKAGAGGRPIGLRAFKSVDRFCKAGLALPDAAKIALGEEPGKWLVSALILAE